MGSTNSEYTTNTEIAMSRRDLHAEQAAAFVQKRAIRDETYRTNLA